MFLQIINIDIWSDNTKSIFKYWARTIAVALITKIFKYTKLVLIEKQVFNFSKIGIHMTALNLRYQLNTMSNSYLNKKKVKEK